MSKATAGQGGPAGSSPKSHHQAAFDHELHQLEKRKLVALRNDGRIQLTREGYLLLVKRFPRRQS